LERKYGNFWRRRIGRSSLLPVSVHFVLQKLKRRGKKMRRDDFLDFASKRLDKCFDVLAAKGKEYDRNDDAFHNFYRGGELLGVEPELALVGMFNKHIISILDIVDDVEQEGIFPDAEILNEKITDAINYLLLLNGLILEHKKEQEAYDEGSDYRINTVQGEDGRFVL